MLYFCGFKVAVFFCESSAHVSHMAFIILCSILTKCRRSSEKKTRNERHNFIWSSLLLFFFSVHFISSTCTHLTLIVDIYVEYVNRKKKWKRLKCSQFLWSNGKVNFWNAPLCMALVVLFYQWHSTARCTSSLRWVVSFILVYFFLLPFRALSMWTRAFTNALRIHLQWNEVKNEFVF